MTIHVHLPGGLHVHLHGRARSGADEAEFREEQHPRDPGGKWTAKGMRPAERSPPGAPRTAAGGAGLPPHIAKLRIPPAWTDVHYSPNPDAALLAVGRDAKGREQRIYSASFAGTQAEAKFRRIEELDAKFASIERQNLANRRNPKLRDSADVARLIMATGIRPGSETDTRAEKQAYGATTLEGRHVDVVGAQVRLRFTGKKGVDLDIPVADPAIAKMLRERAKAAGAGGKLFPQTNAAQLLSYVHTLDSGGFKTKDFRTLLGTRLALRDVAARPVPKTMAAYKKAVLDVARQVATALGNSPTVALQAYISPVAFSKWRVAVEGIAR